MESKHIRVTTISPGVVESELAQTTTDKQTKEWLDNFRKVAIKPDDIGRAVLYAIEQSVDVNVNEVVIQPSQAEY